MLPPTSLLSLPLAFACHPFFLSFLTNMCSGPILSSDARQEPKPAAIPAPRYVSSKKPNTKQDHYLLRNSPIHDPSIITILVGPEELPFRIHEKYAAQSRVFAAAFRGQFWVEARTRMMRLPETSTTFEISSRGSTTRGYSRTTVIWSMNSARSSVRWQAAKETTSTRDFWPKAQKHGPGGYL